ncbi:hypothetical protein HA466_0018560 [Hirschfeldia incana]|nr:hypothetical protein HA466_0018560 [Hirschfeldia incana]
MWTRKGCRATARKTRRRLEREPCSLLISQKILGCVWCLCSMLETIMQRHNESVEKQGGVSNRDDLLTHRYVRRLERSIRRSTYEVDDVSVGMWVESHQSHVFFYQGFSGEKPFSLGVQTEWQLQQMIRFGNCRLMASDSRFGTNKLKYPIHSIVVFDSENKAIPVAWIIAPRVSSGDAYRWMRALCNRVHAKDPLWKVAGFIVDDPFADIVTIRDVFQCPVLFSFWRVRHAWHKNIIKRCPDTETRVEVSRHLGQAVDKICRKQGTATLFEGLLDDLVGSPEFVDYFRAVWSPRIGAWTSALQTLPLASQEICAAMELYHYQMKCRLLNERDSDAYQRTDWLVDKLGTKVHSYFWLDEYTGKDDFARYWKEEWMSGLTSFRKALGIPDSDVVISGTSAKVTDSCDGNEVHVVWSPSSSFGVCSCSWAEKGYICQHMIKLAQVRRGNKTDKESASLLQYYQTLVDLLHCPPRDSLFRDYAASLAVSVGLCRKKLLR